MQTEIAQPIDPTDIPTSDHILACLNSRAYDAAITLCDRRLKGHPADPAALHFAAIALREIGQSQRALDLHAAAIKRAPTRPDYFYHLGQTFMSLKLLTEAASAFAMAERLAPGDVQIALASIRCMYESENPKALTRIEQILLTHRTNVDANLLHGTILLALGNKEESGVAFRKAWDIQPNSPAAIALAKTAPLHKIEDVEGYLFEKAAKKPESLDREGHFAFAEINHRKGDFQTAYSHYLAGNALENQTCNFDIQDERSFCSNMKKAFSRKVETAPFPARDRPAPIFVIGLPRSGSTLVANILATHSQITNLGETGELQNALRRLGTLDLGSEAKSLLHVQESFLGSNAVSGINTPLFLDKNLGNMFYVGHILHAFPNAKIIHIHRDPRAVAWSIFRQCFSRGQWPFANDPQNIVQFHAIFRDLIAFWDYKFPNKIKHVSYEALVKAPERTIRDMIDDLDLPWQHACLTPNTQAGMVTTASKGQVRKSIYTGSNDVWRSYASLGADWLGKLPTSDWIN